MCHFVSNGVAQEGPGQSLQQTDLVRHRSVVRQALGGSPNIRTGEVPTGKLEQGLKRRPVHQFERAVRVRKLHETGELPNHPIPNLTDDALALLGPGDRCSRVALAQDPAVCEFLVARRVRRNRDRAKKTRRHLMRANPADLPLGQGDLIRGKVHLQTQILATDLAIRASPRLAAE